MDFVRMREEKTELSLEEATAGALTVVRRCRPGMLVREAVRGLVGGLISVAVFTVLAGVLGREWAIVVGGLAKDFGLHEGTIQKWLRQADLDTGNPTPRAPRRVRKLNWPSCAVVTVSWSRSRSWR